MKYNPHNYQKYAIEFIKQHPIAAILLDKHICYYDSVESVRQRRALEAKNFRGFLRE